MGTETTDWKPEIGKTAWHNAHDGSKGNEIREVSIERREDVLGSTSFVVYCKKNGGTWDYIGMDGLFPTAEAALASIKVYDLDGNEVVVSPRPEPSELVWEVNGMCAVAEDPNFLYLIDTENSTFSVRAGKWLVIVHEGSFDDKTVVGGKAAVHAWRVKFLEGMTGGAKP